MKHSILITLILAVTPAAFANPFKLFTGTYSVTKTNGSCGWLGSPILNQVEVANTAKGMKIVLREKFGNLSTYLLNQYDYVNEYLPTAGNTARIEKTTNGVRRITNDYTVYEQNVAVVALENTGGAISLNVTLKRILGGTEKATCQYSADLMKN